ncbi:MAG TPA: leucyl aminopeptidase [Gammaproteobacteria bacterium]|nr:leucyl aminopeptidase [Gammaproteobacteria bacterium]
MQTDFTTQSVTDLKAGCVAVTLFEDRQLSPSAKKLDVASSGRLKRLVKGSNLEGKTGQQLLLHGISGINSDRVLLVGAGKRGKVDSARFRRIVDAVVSGCRGSGADSVAVFLSELDVAERDNAWKVRCVVESFHQARYRFDQLKSEKSSDQADRLETLTCAISSSRELAKARQASREAQAVAAGSALAKTLGDLPGNICTPSYLADQARKIGREHKSVRVRVRGESEMKRLKMGTLLSVARGSEEPAKLITLEYSGAKKSRKPITLVGKGVTFDSGGISIKPAAAMDEMKYDMCGAASVLGTIKAVAELKLKVNLVGIIPATENLPGGRASKPGDIFTSMSGQSVEVLNTDAEGRLILCDALTFAAGFKPEVVIDIATLTGACVIALGSHASGLWSNDEGVSAALLKAGDYSGDRAWQMPLWEEYEEQLKSNFADMANVGGREAGAITAASFLSKFTRDYSWAHLDIAGTAWRSGKNKGATGRPVPLLTQYIIDRASGKAPRRSK